MKRIFFSLMAVVLIGCSQKFPEADNVAKEHFDLLDQNSQSQNYPECVKGKITVVGYIFTNCPDICPLTTNNMRLIQEKLKKEKIKDVQFVSISFDPLQDSPETLRKFAEIRNLDLSNWKFLVGTKQTTDSLMKRMNILAVVGDSTVFTDGKKIYYYVHTDRIQLMDRDGVIRKSYKGSAANVDEVVNDIRKLD